MYLWHVKIGCQTIVWGDRIIQQELDRVLSEVKASGYAGVEIGAHISI